MPLIEYLLAVNLLHLLNKELDILDLLNNGLPLGFPGQLDVFLIEFILSAAQEEYHIQVLVVCPDNGFHCQDEFNDPYDDEERVREYDGRQE